ncbi:MAG: hypothetical protein E7466_07230 [Ruminococcaceae bacterium]|nr:hypothetical protein [Oscillospiraceae bacterium]
MKGEKIASCLISSAICFCMSFGAVACVATGLGLHIDLSLLCIGCLLGALVAAAAYSVRYGGRILLGASALYLLGILIYTDFFDGILTLCRDATRIYSRAYGIQVPQILEDSNGTSPLLALLVVAGLVNLVTAWIMLHRFPSALAIFVAILPVASCFVVTDTVPTIWALGIWLFGMALLVLSQSCRIRDPHAANRLTGLITVPLLLVLSLLFSLVPERGFQPPVEQAQLQGITEWALQHLPFVGQTSDGTLVINFGGDRSDHMDLSTLDDRNLSGSVVAEVESERGGKLYLRGRDYDSYTGTGWEATDRTETFSTPTQTGQPYYLRVQVFGNRRQKLVPYYTGETLTMKDGTVASNARSYEFDVAPLDDDWVQQWRANKSQNADAPDDRYLSLPADTFSSAQSILAEIPKLNGADTVAAAEAIGGYVSWSANYSLRVDRMPSGEDDFAIWFLRHATQGYCVHFATAATVLLRAQGIPARYVEGYALDVDAGQINKIPQSASHAWVEYYVEGVGWVVLDPTPGLGQDFERPEKPTQPSTSRPTSRPPKPTDPPAPTETNPPTSTTKPAQPKPSDSTATQPPSGSDNTPSGTGTGSFPIRNSAGTIPSEPEPVPTFLVWILIGLAILVVTLSAVMGQWFFRRLHRIRQLRHGNTNQRVLALHREAKQICKILHADIPEDLQTLAKKAAFSQHALTKEELATANDAYLRCHSLLRKGRWYQRLLWRFIFALY